MTTGSASQACTARLLACAAKPNVQSLVQRLTWDQVFQFEIADDALFYVAIASGELQVLSGRSPQEELPVEQQYMEVTHIEMDAETLRDILRGSIIPGEALFQGRFKVREGGKHWVYQVLQVLLREAARAED